MKILENTEKEQKIEFLKKLNKYKRLFSLYKIVYGANDNSMWAKKNDLIFEIRVEPDNIKIALNAYSIGVSVDEYELYFFLKNVYQEFKKHDAKVFLIENLPKDKVKLINRHLVKVL